MAPPPGRPRRSRGGAGSDRTRTEVGLGGEQVEGRQAVRELLRARRRSVHQVLVAEGAHGAGPLEEIVELAAAAGVAVRRVGRDRIDANALSDSPQGVIARADPLPESDLATLATRRGAGGQPPFLVVLDGITDPHNLGAVMRNALGAGATGLVMGRHRSARLTPTAVKAAAGAVEYLPVAPVAGIPAALADLSAAGVWTVALDAAASAAVWDLAVATEPIALVLGSEGRGLSRLARQRCDLAVAVPLAGPVGSLNVSAAAALGCFEVARRRAAGPGGS